MVGEEPERLSELLAIRSEDELKAFVIAERAAKHMRIDDSRLAILRFDEGEDAVKVFKTSMAWAFASLRVPARSGCP